MPEYPDVVIYLESLERKFLNDRLTRIRLASPFLLRSVTPPITDVEGKRLTHLRRLGKRIVLAFEDDLFLVLHLMIAGRLRWRKRADPPTPIPKRRGLAAFDFESATLLLTEASTKKRASLHLVRGEEALLRHDPGGVDPFAVTLSAFTEALTRENHTLKRALTDPRTFSGIGNAYSDEILHRARLSPFKLTRAIQPEEARRLFECTRTTLTDWTDRTREELGDAFPDKVTAFREGMAVHGRYREPCPDCGSPVQRIRYAEHETNYCATCQTGGKLLADRALSRLLKDDWPRTVEEWERLGTND